MLCFRHSNLIWVCCTISQHLWCCPGEGDVPQPLVAALSSPSAQTTLISAVTGAPLHPKSLLPPLSTFLFFCGLFPAHPVEEGGATTVHSWDFCCLARVKEVFLFIILLLPTASAYRELHQQIPEHSRLGAHRLPQHIKQHK